MFTDASFANAPFWGVLPMGMTNYGGDTQIFTVEPYQNYNIGLALNSLATGGGYWNINAGQPIYPNTNKSAVDDLTARALAPTYNKMASQNINIAGQNLLSCKTRLQAMLNSKDTTEEQKTAINNLIAKIEAAEKKLEELKKSSDLNPEEAYKKSREIYSEVQALVKEIADTVNGFTATNTTDTTATTGTTDTTATTNTTGTTSTTSTTGTTNTTSTTGTTATTQGTTDNFDNDTQDWVEQMFDAIDGPGTGDFFDTGCSDIDENNVMDRMLCWNKYKYGDHNETFMQAFMWDANRSQKIEYGKKIALALRKKADELGIYEKCKEDFAAINKQMNSWVYVNNDVYKNYDNIIAEIAKKTGSKYGNPGAQAA